MDGFFVAKFKVDRRGKQAQVNGVAEEVPPQKMINEAGDVVEEGIGKAAFDESADQAYIEGGHRSVLPETDLLMRYREQAEAPIQDQGDQVEYEGRWGEGGEGCQKWTDEGAEGKEVDGKAEGEVRIPSHHLRLRKAAFILHASSRFTIPIHVPLSSTQTFTCR